MRHAYPAGVIRHDPAGRQWSLAEDFDTTMLWHILPGEGSVRVLDAAGLPRGEGLLIADRPILLERPGGGALRVEPVTVDGKWHLYLSDEELIPGLAYREERPASSGHRAARPEEIAGFAALGSGTMVATEDGAQPIDWLRPGDRLLTRDNGHQPLLWLGRHTMPRRAPATTRPLQIAPATFGEARPERPLTLSPGTGILLAGPELARWFGEQEMLARTSNIAAEAQMLEGSQTLYTLLFAAPEVILAEGMWVASVQASAAYVALLPDRARSALGGHLAAGHAEAARAWLADWQVAMFRRERIARKRQIAG